MVVTRLMEGGTAQLSKQIFPGDIIVSIDGIATHGWDLAKVIFTSKMCDVHYRQFTFLVEWQVVGNLTGPENSNVSVSCLSLMVATVVCIAKVHCMHLNDFEPLPLHLPFKAHITVPSLSLGKLMVHLYTHVQVRIGLRRNNTSFEITLQRTRASLPSPVRFARQDHECMPRCLLNRSLHQMTRFVDSTCRRR